MEKHLLDDTAKKAFAALEAALTRSPIEPTTVTLGAPIARRALDAQGPAAVGLHALYARSVLPVDIEPVRSALGTMEDAVVIVVHGRDATLQRMPPVDARTVFQVLQMIGATRKPPALPAHEAALLDAAGLPENRAAEVAATMRKHSELDELVGHESMSLEEAARAFRVSPSRLRQRLGDAQRTLYGIKGDDGQWRVPRFQFAAPGKLVRNLAKVLPNIGRDVHPLSVRSFFTSKSPDLALNDGASLSPLEWLEGGHPIAPLIALAQEL